MLVQVVIAADPNGTEMRRKNANPLMFNELAFLCTALFSVGATGFEPATSCSRSRRTGFLAATDATAQREADDTCDSQNGLVSPVLGKHLGRFWGGSGCGGGAAWVRVAGRSGIALVLCSTKCYTFDMAGAPKSTRVFKTAWFTKAARKAAIGDDELCRAVKQAQAGQCDDLGGGVYKKRVSRNLYRSIVLAKGGRHWVLTYLFAKKDRANIDAAELSAFRELAKGYEKLTAAQLNTLLTTKDLEEICHGDPA